MELLYRFKRRLLIKIMTALGFGGMAAFCVTGCDSSPQKKDKPSDVSSPEQAQKEAPQQNADTKVPAPAETQEQKEEPQQNADAKVPAPAETQEQKEEPQQNADAKVPAPAETQKQAAPQAAHDDESSSDDAKPDNQPLSPKKKTPNPNIMLTLYV